jgi:uncharacterized membrane protein
VFSQKFSSKEMVLDSRSQETAPKELRILIAILIILGIFFRCVNLDKPVYWFDETFTSLRVSGHTEEEVIQEISSQKILDAGDLLEQYQQFHANTGLADTLKGLAVEEPQLTPLYFIMARFWAMWFGSSIAAIRSLSVLFALLTFPCLYWFCKELFNSSLIAWTSVALFAVSPFQVLFAQEARPYSLFILVSFLSSAVLLRALRLNTQRAWVAYAGSVALGLYSFLFFSLVLLSHTVYVIGVEGIRWNKKHTNFTVTAIVGILAFSPWIMTILSNPSPMVGLGSRDVALLQLVKAWILNLSLVFIDFDRGWCFPIGTSYCRFPLNLSDPLIYIIVPVLILEIYAFYELYRKTPRRVWLFPVALTIVNLLALILPDALMGGHRSSITRYLVPCFLGIQLAVPACLSFKAFIQFLKAWQQKLWQLILALLVSAGVLSCVFIEQAEAWWTKGQNYQVPQVANILNQSERPLLIYWVSSGVGTSGRIMPLLHELKPTIKVRYVVDNKDFPEIPEGFSDVFVYRPSQEFRARLEGEKYQFTPSEQDPIDQRTRLWKLENP